MMLACANCARPFKLVPADNLYERNICADCKARMATGAALIKQLEEELDSADAGEGPPAELYRRAGRLIKSGRYRDAEPLLQTALLVDPGNGAGASLLAMCIAQISGGTAGV